jgi:RNA polymerase sigma-70 factor (ECF subfamily)
MQATAKRRPGRPPDGATLDRATLDGATLDGATVSGATPDGSGPARLGGTREVTKLPGSEEFARLTEPFRAELLAHCYRMLGSVYDAEDQVQETLVRAWRSYGEFQGRASLRTWLYRIATNACLRAIENRGRRPLPSGLGSPSDDPYGPLAGPRTEVPWLQPFPDALLPGRSADPAEVAVSRESVRLALIAALQYLPPRQRAVLLLRDVLGWHAAEVAGLLDTTVTAVNSALQRARDQLREAAPAQDAMREPADAGQRDLLDRYAAAFETADVTGLMRLLREDAVFEMPPQPAWFAGRELIGRFLAAKVLPERAFRMLPIAANGQPALAAYLREDDGVFRAHAIQVLTVSAGQITRLVSFNDAGLFPAFGLPPTFPVTAPEPR